MVPTPFENFFTAMAGGGTTLLGLLFVAVSIRHAGCDEDTESGAEALVADGSLLALADGFVVSASALVPGVNLAFVVLPMAAIAVLWVSKVSIRLLQTGWTASPAERARALIPTAVALGGALSQLVLGVGLLLNPEGAVTLRWLAINVLVFYGIGLLQSWTLTGGQRRGLRALLAPVRRGSDAPEAAVGPASRTRMYRKKRAESWSRTR